MKEDRPYLGHILEAAERIVLYGQDGEDRFRRDGVEILWIRGATEAPPQGSEVIITFSPRAPDHVPPGAMGLVNPQQRPPRNARIFLAAVEQAVNQAPDRFRSEGALEKARLPIALARVVAHEVFHAVVPEEPHSRDGLMCGKVERAFLLGARPSFEPRSAAAFRRGLAAVSASTSSTGTSSSTQP